MQLEFEFVQSIVQGRNPIVLHGADNNVFVVYTAADGKMKAMLTSTPLGEWEDRIFTDGGVISGEVNDTYLKSKSLTGIQNVFVWKSESSYRIALDPSAFTAEDPTSPYRLYYGTDTEKLYMNIADSWEFIASKKHELLSNIGTKSHAELEISLNNKIDKVTILTIPATATDTGVAPDIRIDADYIYICVATNTWKRVPIATW